MTGPAATLPPPCVLHEDEHVLAVCKPAGWNTHAPSPYAGEGIFEWLRDREPRWRGLAIVHRLDKDTSGILLFPKTALARRSLTGQFSRQEIRKRYELLTDRTAPDGELRVESSIIRAGSRYRSVPPGPRGPLAVTLFSAATGLNVGARLVSATPLTGRTHQIRVHAAASGFPVLGDALYGGSPAARLCLHAASIGYRDPSTGEARSLAIAADFAADPAEALRAAFIDPQETSAFRLLHGAADQSPGCRVDRLGEFLLAQGEEPPGEKQLAALSARGYRSVYFRRSSRQVRETPAAEAAPRRIAGEPAPERFTVSENGARYELGFAEGYSVGLFLDQRDNRRRFLTRHVAADFPLYAPEAAAPEVLNAFAYTCGFSVCAALGGARVTSLDLSKKYLDWGQRNFALNGLDPAAHDFIFGDAFDWLRRLARRQRRFDALVLDPPTFSQSKQHGRFRVEHDYPRLLSAALPLLGPGGVLLACANTVRLEAPRFMEMVNDAVRAAGRGIVQAHYAPQPPDFPVSREEPAYLKTCWLRLN